MSRRAATAATAAAACALLLAQVGASPAWAEGRVVDARHDDRPVASAPVLDLEAPSLELEAPDEYVEMPVEPLEDTDEGP